MNRDTLLITVDDAEPVVVETDHDTVTLILDDGRTVLLDRVELHAATQPVGARLRDVAA